MSYADTPFDLTGRAALVTGAYRGLGFAIAQGLARVGAKVVLNGRKADALATAAQSLTAGGGSADIAVFDVTDRDAVRGGVAAIIATHGDRAISPRYAWTHRWPPRRPANHVVDQCKQVDSPIGRQSGILVHVHPGFS